MRLPGLGSRPCAVSQPGTERTVCSVGRQERNGEARLKYGLKRPNRLKPAACCGSVLANRNNARDNSSGFLLHPDGLRELPRRGPTNRPHGTVVLKRRRKPWRWRWFGAASTSVALNRK